MSRRVQWKFLIAGIAIAGVASAAFLIFMNNSPEEECTQAAIYAPLTLVNGGFRYVGDVEDASPVILKHRNGGYEHVARYYIAGAAATGGNYSYEHGFISAGEADTSPSYKQMNMGMNARGSAFATMNWGGTEGPDDYTVREKALALADDFNEMANLIAPESIPNTAVIAGYKNGLPAVAYQQQEVVYEITPENPFWLSGVDEDNGKRLFNDPANWSRGDPGKLDVRDVAYIWHRINPDSDITAMFVPKYKIMWCTIADPHKGPFIPFDLNDPYIYQKLQDPTYSKWANYSQSEIDAIEDLIMASDGAVIGDVRDIQMRIAEGLPIVHTSCSDAGGQCLPNSCNTYSNCSSVTGTCSPGYCCSGTCTATKEDINWDGKVDQADVILCVRVALGNEIDPAVVAKADINGDGNVNAIDIQMIVNKALGK